MSTATSTAPRLITPTDQPVVPCWVWESTISRWHLFTFNDPGPWGKVWTHWVPAEATPPAPPGKPQQPVDRVTPEDRKLAAELHAQRGGDLTSITLGLCYGRVAAEKRAAEEIEGYRRDRNQAVETSEKLDARVEGLKAEIERLKCSHSDMADLYAKEHERADTLSRALQVREAVLKNTEIEVTRLKVQLEAAEQHVKILTADRDEQGATVKRLMEWSRISEGRDKVAAAEIAGLNQQLSQVRQEAADAQVEAYQERRRAENLSRALETNARIDQHEAKRAAKVVQPQGKVHPWRAAEVPLAAWARFGLDAWHGDATRYLITAVLRDSVRLGNGKDYDFTTLAEGWDYSTDGGKTWLPAGRVEQ